MGEHAVKLLAVDVGNSNIKFGVHDGSHWVHLWPVATVPDKMPDEYAVLLRSFLDDARIEATSIPRVVMSSVVPQLTDGLATMLERHTSRVPLRLGLHLDLGIRVTTEHPHHVGTDLIANAVAGYDRLRTSCIVVNFGTATTLSGVSADGELRGVSIAAGLAVTANALVSGAARLAHVALEHPASTLGRNTTEAMQSGLVIGHLAMVEGLVARIQSELGPAKVIATGGLATVLADHTDVFDAVDPYLTLEGLRIVADRNP